MKTSLWMLISTLLFLHGCKQIVSPKCYGVYLGQSKIKELTTELKQRYGHGPCIISVFWAWSDQPFNNKKILDQIWNSGAIPLLTIEPWYYPSKKPISLKSIINGEHDAILSELAMSLKKYNHPIIVRFAHEMNGDWYPWSGQNNHQNTSLYIEAYQHFTNILARYLTKTNYLRMWSINTESVPNESWNSSSHYWPGSKYVDVIGVDGYNWGLSKKWSSWITFYDLFQNQLSSLQQKYSNTPIIISEVASGKKGGQRSDWITKMFNSLSEHFPNVIAIVWFDINKELKWSLKKDYESAKAFRKGITTNRFNCRREVFLQYFRNIKE